jgi:signal transduction histidine kinase
MSKGCVSPVRRLCIITGDGELVQSCREALQVWNGSVSIRQDSRADAAADLWVWDCRSSAAIPQDLPARELAKSVFLIDRRRLAEFPEEVLLSAATVALLPIDVARLSIVLEQAFARQTILARTRRGEDQKSTADALLQCFLQANLKLQEYDQDRTNFLNRVLHDFRAPLTSITGYCGILRSGAAGNLDMRQSELVQRIEGSAKRLSRLADGLFQLGIRRVKRIQPELIKGDIASTVETAVAEVDAFLTQKQLIVTAQIEEPETDLLFEPEQIVKVLINILENACRFSPRGSTISIKAYSYFLDRRSPGAVDRPRLQDRRKAQRRVFNCYRVDISDSGPGVLPEHLDSIFEEYTSYAGGRDRSGTGLGLAISKGIIELHKGRIWAESRAVGATFSFVLPFSVAAPDAERALVAGASLA